MTGFALDPKGDVVIQNNNIVMVSDKELTRQTVRTVLGTNKGEWFLNEDEGIDFQTILIKNPDFDVVRGEVIGALSQVDENLTLEDFKCTTNADRTLDIDFTAKDVSGNVVYSTNERLGGSNNSSGESDNGDYESDNDYENDMTERISEARKIVIS